MLFDAYALLADSTTNGAIIIICEPRPQTISPQLIPFRHARQQSACIRILNIRFVFRKSSSIEFSWWSDR